MYRIFRPASLLACVGMFSGLSAVQAADEPDYTLDSAQIPLASAASGSTNDDLDELDALEPTIAVSPEHGVALAVWVADDTATVADDDDDTTTRRLVNDEFEVYAGLVNASSLTVAGVKLRVSTMGNDAETVTAERQRYAARNPAVAWNPVAEEFLVVWEGDDDSAPLVDGEFEIFGQRIGVDGKAVGERIRISVMGDDAATDSAQRALYDAARPSVAANPVTGEYLVTWQGDDDTAPLADEKIEIFGRPLNSEGVPAVAQFRISTTGNDADAVLPDVVFNPVASTFFVTWQADASVDDQHEIHLQQLDAQGTLVGTPVQVSAMGTSGDALSPALAVDPDAGTMLVAWHGDVVAAPLVDDELEIHGSVCDAVGTCATQFRISTMGLEAEADPVTRMKSVARNAAAAWSVIDQRFLVTWSGDTPEGVLVDDEFEIFGAFVEPSGSVPVDEIRISVQGDDTEETASDRILFGADRPAVAYGSGSFLTLWEGDSNIGNDIDNRMIIFGQRVAATHTQLELRVPHMSDRNVPDPVEITLTVTNAGDAVATNTRVTASVSEESFPYAWQNCPLVTDDDVCELGDVAPDAVVELKLVLTTDHIELGDKQSTSVGFQARTDTALVNPSFATRQIFVGVTLDVEGGSGTIDLFWLALLFGVPLVSSRRLKH